MPETHYFRDYTGRRCAILQAGERKVLAWKSTSKNEWFISPFIVDMPAPVDTWIAKGRVEELPKVPEKIAKQLDKIHAKITKVPNLTGPQIKELARKNELIRKSEKAKTSWEEILAKTRTEEQRRELEANMAHVALGLCLDAADEFKSEIEGFYSELKPEEIQLVKREWFPRIRRMARAIRERKKYKPKKR